MRTFNSNNCVGYNLLSLLFWVMKHRLKTKWKQTEGSEGNQGDFTVFTKYVCHAIRLMCSHCLKINTEWIKVSRKKVISYLYTDFMPKISPLIIWIKCFNLEDLGMNKNNSETVF